MEKRKSSLDLIRVIAIFFVVMIHSLPNLNKENIGFNDILFVNFLHGILNAGVPLFLMISGALLLDREETIKETLIRTRRIVLALLIFGTLMSFTEHFLKGENILKSVVFGFFDVLSFNTWDVMWYLYMLTGIYLFLPLLRKFVKNANDKEIEYILILLFIFNGIFPVINSVFGKKIIGFTLPVSGIFLFYFIFGYYITKRRDKKINKKLYFPLILIFLILIGIATFINCKYNLNNNLLDYNSILTIFLSVLIFTRLKDINCNIKCIKNISENTFGIYLIHCFLIHFMNIVLNIHTSDFIIYLSIPLISIVIFVISYIITFILRKIPVLRKYVL